LQHHAELAYAYWSATQHDDNILDEISTAISSLVPWTSRLSHAGLLAAFSGGLVALAGRHPLVDCRIDIASGLSAQSQLHAATRMVVQRFIFASSSLLYIAVCLLLSSVAVRFGLSTPLARDLTAICPAFSLLAASIIAFRLVYVMAQTLMHLRQPLAPAAQPTADQSHHVQKASVELPNPQAGGTPNPADSPYRSWRAGISKPLKTSFVAISTIVVSLHRPDKVTST